jgi:hypothetical protein
MYGILISQAHDMRPVARRRTTLRSPITILRIAFRNQTKSS